ncbi:MAG TPA: PSD1 and planctomycete cytochrome C domain-containing protein, partial [Candidatus Acidoferrum sp.]|nr:PSD1 and planctomycete cytochrome C domain-containing protein [Candidatus Acidoferrum sp.]
MFASIALMLVAGVSMHAASLRGDDQFFRAKVEPIFREHCYKCHSHSAEKIKGGLVLDSRAALLTGGDSGASIVPGSPEKSLLLAAVSYTNDDLQMPPKGAKLSAEKIATLREWVKQGAPWSGDGNVETKNAASSQLIPKRPRGAKISDEDRKWWAFQPVKAVEPPVISGSVISKSVKRTSTSSLNTDSPITDYFPQNEIDRFILARLEAEKLTPAPRASRTALIRRVTFDLTGLPPTPQEVAAFITDKSPDAYPKLVDRLLASPRYGERWARHWLDLVRYAESDGYRVDDFRPNAWRYRDYVVRSLNADKPYDRFVQEQIAGDELWPEDPDARIATGYLTLWIYEYNNRDAVGQIATILNDVTDTTADVFLGQGVQCARCHDHKFDPILQKDYFRLQAFFAPMMPVAEAPIANGGERAAYAQEMAAWEKKSAAVRARLEELEEPFREKGEADALSKFPKETQALIKKPIAERTPYEHQVAELAYRQVLYEWSDKRFPARVKEPAKTERNRLLEQLRAMEKDMPAPLAMAPQVTDVGADPPPTFIPKKEKLGAIEPGYLSVLDEAPAKIETGWTNSTGRRTTLAHWLTRTDNPLTTRVIVNRVWQYHFGLGLAPITSDFGVLGEKPSHPELLDWLTRRFIEEGWSLKKLHKLIVTSATYQQVGGEVISRPVISNQSADRKLNTDALITNYSRARTLDPENRLLWHFPTRRLDAEQVRDAVLAVTGELDLQDGGPPVDFSTPRRSVYNKVFRNTRDPVIEVFDGPENFASTSQRNVTTTPTQSLMMMNSKWALARAKALASRLLKEQPGNESAQIDAAYQL